MVIGRVSLSSFKLPHLKHHLSLLLHLLSRFCTLVKVDSQVSNARPITVMELGGDRHGNNIDRATIQYFILPQLTIMEVGTRGFTLDFRSHHIGSYPVENPLRSTWWSPG